MTNTKLIDNYANWGGGIFLANEGRVTSNKDRSKEDSTLVMTGADDEAVLNCDEVLAEFFGEEYIPAKDEEAETAA